MAIILLIFIIFPCHCAVYMYKIMILQKNHLANFYQISHWSYCWNVIDRLFKWSCSIDCRAHIFFFKTKNCSNDDIFISCDDRIGKMLHNICMSAVAMSLRWASHGPWASCSALWSLSFSYRRCIDSGYLVIATLHTILYQSCWNFAHIFSGVCRSVYGLDIIHKFTFVTSSTLLLSFSCLRFYESI